MELLGTLFESMQDRTLARVYELLRGKDPNGLEPTAMQRALLRVLVNHCGAARAVSATRLAGMVGSDDRAVRSDVRDLRMLFGVRIGSSRDSKEAGYYLIATRDELFDTCRPFLHQAAAEFALVRSLCDPHELAELEGQLKLTLTPATPEAPHAA